MDHEQALLNRRISRIAELACAMEMLAPKPGNVSPGRPFRYLNEMTFIASAAGMADAFADPGLSVGKLVVRAARTTKRLTERNANLGIILLLAPLVRAASDVLTENSGGAQEDGISPLELRRALSLVLAGLDADDSSSIYAAIRSAAPEGLGGSEKYDVNDFDADGGTQTAPPVLEAMRFASPRDSIAREYVTDYGITFDFTAPKLTALWEEGLELRSSVVQTFLFLMSEVPDTLIERKLGRKASEDTSSAAGRAFGLGGPFTGKGKMAVRDLSRMLDDPDNLLNPGATADLMAAGIFVFLEAELRRTPLPEILARWDKKTNKNAKI